MKATTAWEHSFIKATGSKMIQFEKQSSLGLGDGIWDIKSRDCLLKGGKQSGKQGPISRKQKSTSCFKKSP